MLVMDCLLLLVVDVFVVILLLFVFLNYFELFVFNVLLLSFGL